MRGATRGQRHIKSSPSYFNPRSSCEERRGGARDLPGQLQISIHAPHARSDMEKLGFEKTGEKFQSTLLMRGATPQAGRHVLGLDFNPRSSCEERPRAFPWYSDNIGDFNPRSSCEERLPMLQLPGMRKKYFNPRSSCEERHPRRCLPKREAAFQSTLLMRGATGTAGI